LALAEPAEIAERCSIFSNRPFASLTQDAKDAKFCLNRVPAWKNRPPSVQAKMPDFRNMLRTLFHGANSAERSTQKASALFLIVTPDQE